MARLLTWNQGQTFGVIEVQPMYRSDRKTGRRVWVPVDATGRHAVMLVVTNDGVNWTATRTADLDDSLRSVRVQQWNAGSAKLESRYRLPLQWARDTAKEPDRTYSIAAPQTASTETLIYADPDLQEERDGVTYVAWGKIRKRSAHSLADLHRIVEQAVLAGRSIWSWTPQRLEVQFHKDSRSMGLAYEPGTDESRQHCRISLHERLLEEYDLKSIWRVVVHELCHHFRDDNFPPSRIPHDEIFCEQLGLIDPMVRGDRQQCAMFVNEKDTALVAVKQERIEKRKTPPVWSPDAGTLILYNLKNGALKVEWRPEPGYRWTKWIVNVTGVTMLDLAKKFAPLQWKDVRVLRQRRGRLVLTDEPYTFEAVVVAMIRSYPRHMQDLASYVEELKKGPIE